MGVNSLHNVHNVQWKRCLSYHAGDSDRAVVWTVLLGQSFSHFSSACNFLVRQWVARLAALS